ncbi:MAG: coenzyme F420-0:L-glutamate ligase [Halobacteriota archaeon]
MLENKIEAFPLKVREPATVDTCLGKSIGEYIADVLLANSLTLEHRDVLVVVSKLVSIFEGRIVKLSEIEPSLKARVIGKAFSKNPKKVELILREGRIQFIFPMRQIYKIPSLRARYSTCTADPEGFAKIREERGETLMVRTNGVLLDDAGIDFSNVPAGSVALLPIDANASASEIRRSVHQATGKEIAVIVTDSAGVFGKLGTQDIALGCAGLDPINRNCIADDVFGNREGGDLELVADSLAALSGLLVGQNDEAIPMCLIRGLAYQPEKEEGGMKVVAYPPGVLVQSVFLTALNTIFYYFLHILTLPFGTRKDTSKRLRQTPDERWPD